MEEDGGVSMANIGEKLELVLKGKKRLGNNLTIAANLQLDSAKWLLQTYNYTPPNHCCKPAIKLHQISSDPPISKEKKNSILKTKFEISHWWAPHQLREMAESNSSGQLSQSRAYESLWIKGWIW